MKRYQFYAWKRKKFRTQKSWEEWQKHWNSQGFGKKITESILRSPGMPNPRIWHQLISIYDLQKAGDVYGTKSLQVSELSQESHNIPSSHNFTLNYHKKSLIIGSFALNRLVPNCLYKMKGHLFWMIW